MAAAAALAVAGAASWPAVAGAQTPATPTTAVTSTTASPCAAPLPAAATFVGRVVGSTPTQVRFAVTQLRAGKLAGTTVDVDYAASDDARFLKDGHSYLVVAATDPESGLLVSKVRHPHGEAPACSKADPILTRQPDGTEVDTALFAGMSGQWSKVGLAFLLPTAIVLAVLLAIVIVKHTFLFTGRTAIRVRDHHRSRPSRPRGPAAPAGAPAPDGRTRTRSAPPSPG
jgi:hypothetical protein